MNGRGSVGRGRRAHRRRIGRARLGRRAQREGWPQKSEFAAGPPCSRTSKPEVSSSERSPDMATPAARRSGESRPSAATTSRASSSRCSAPRSMLTRAGRPRSTRVTCEPRHTSAPTSWARSINACCSSGWCTSMAGCRALERAKSRSKRLTPSNRSCRLACASPRSPVFSEGWPSLIVIFLAGARRASG